jgi:AcrR family transcriptional regulator
MSPDRKRADAARNRARLLAAAREVLAEAGNEAALDVIARRAGVGNATLYRHFPTRADLLVAVYADEVEALCARGADLLESAEPVDALFAWLDEFVVHVATKRPLALAAAEGPGELFHRWHESIISTATRLMERARPELRPGLTVLDVLALANGAALATGTEHARRLVALLRTGVEAGGATRTTG